MKLFLLTSFLLVLASPAVQAGLVILQYHHVSESTPPETSIAPDQFAEHLAMLERNNMEVVDLADAIKRLQAGKPLPERAVAITFDDAYDSIHSEAFPLLRERHWPFTVFVNPGPVDRAQTGFMSWDDLREMHQHGATIANHTMEHPYLIERPREYSLNEWLTQEVLAAEQRLKDEIGTSPSMLAYPYGEYSIEIADWLQRQNIIAFGQHSGAVGSHTDWQAVPRFPAAGRYADITTLEPKLKTLAFETQGERHTNPPLTGNNPPKLTLDLRLSDFSPGSLQCFASHEGSIPITTSQEDDHIRLETRAESPITAGRGRYNCTASSQSRPGYYYWYSQLWINTSVANR